MNSTNKHTSTDELEEELQDILFSYEVDVSGVERKLVKGNVLPQEAERRIKIYQKDARTSILRLIKTNYILKADVVEAVPYQEGGTAMGRNYHAGKRVGWNECRSQILESLNLEGQN
jgi:hypothetical protein